MRPDLDSASASGLGIEFASDGVVGGDDVDMDMHSWKRQRKYRGSFPGKNEGDIYTELGVIDIEIMSCECIC